MPNHLLKPLLLVFSLTLILVACTEQAQRSSSHISGPTMGTLYTIKITDLPSSIKQASLKSQINAVLQEINQQMSTYQADSALSLINQHKDDTAITLSDALWAVLNEAQRIHTLSNGAFDITVGPLVNLWGFGPKQQTEDNVPDAASIRQAMQYTGMHRVILDAEQHSLAKQAPQVYLDLSAIAKGYAVDRIATLLTQKNIENYMVEIGGELKTQGVNAKGQPWQIAIEKPSSSSQNIYKIIQPGSHAVATSGDYRNYFEIDGLRYSHTIDPRNGQPVSHKLASVTIIHTSAMTADALATALLVLGPDAGYKLAEKLNLAALLISKSDNGFESRATTSFNSYLTKQRL